MAHLGELERAVMEFVWSRAEHVSVRDVVDNIDREPHPAYTTVMTVMDRLWRKSFLTRTVEGKAYLYRAMAPREAYVAELMTAALGTAADRRAALLCFVADMNDEDVSHLQRVLAARRRTTRT